MTGGGEHLVEERVIELAVHGVRRLNREDAHSQLQLFIGKAGDDDLPHLPRVCDENVVENRGREAGQVRAHQLQRLRHRQVWNVIEEALERGHGAAADVEGVGGGEVGH